MLTHICWIFRYCLSVRVNIYYSHQKDSGTNRDSPA
nr:MAG TPA: hypothetical protein [Caudoviricetes sp.]